MNDLFDLTRFGRLCYAHWVENRREYAWFAGIAAMIDLIFVLINFSSDSGRTFSSFQFEGQIVWYCSGLLVSAIIFAGRHFRHLASPGSALISLMRPGSHLEKWLLAFLVVGVMYPLAYTLLYSALHFPVVELARHWYVAMANCDNCANPPALADFRFYIPLISHEPARVADGAHLFLKRQIFVLLLLWSGQGLILGGTLFFRRSPVLRTILALFLLAVLITWLGTAPHMGAFWSATGKELVPYSAAETALSLGLWCGLPLLLWLAAFFHLQNRELA